ncbi:MAG: DUF6756 family protein [Pseudomonadota bacterium]
MAIVSNTEEVDRAIRELGVRANRISPENERQTYEAVLNTFSGGKDGIWLWEHFTEPSFGCELAHFSETAEIVPDPKEQVWFMVEEDHSPKPIYCVSVTGAISIVGDCFAFEYYLIDTKLQWILCENHHDWVVGSGSICERLKRSAA